MVQRKADLMLTFEGDPVAANYLLDEWPEGLLAHTANPTIPVFVVSAIAAQPQATPDAGCGQVVREQRPTTRRRFTQTSPSQLLSVKFWFCCRRPCRWIRANANLPISLREM